MLETVGHPHAVNPDRQLRKIAVARGWPVLEFAATNGDPRRPSRPDPQPVSRSDEPVRHVNSRIDKDHESITAKLFPSRGIRRRNESRTTGPDTATGYPRATSRGRRPRQEHSGPNAAGDRDGCPARQRRCTLGNPDLTWFRRRPARGAACFVLPASRQGLLPTAVSPPISRRPARRSDTGLRIPLPLNATPSECHMI